jgi:glycosyltransferase involved in cell wall biosynthesis
MRIIYLSKTCSKKTFNAIYEKSRVKPQQQDQKFHQMMIEGLHANQIEVIPLSSRPINRNNLKKVCFRKSVDQSDDINYIHLSFINLKLFRQITLFFSAFFELIKILLKNKKDTYLIADPLNLSLSYATVMVGKLFKVPIIALTTDLPSELTGSKFFKQKVTKLIKSYDKHIMLSIYANEKLNPKHKPYLIIEGMVYPEMLKEYPNEEVFTMLYAGGLSQSSGIETLLQAFDELKLKDAKLQICGSGELVELVESYASRNHDIIYLGTLKNSEVLILESKAHVLVNPRRSTSEETKYAFPSKIMEYLLSATPILSTKLQGISEEYNQFLIYIKEETVEGFKEGILTFYNMSDDQRLKLGRKGRGFVLTHKTNEMQARRVIEFLRKE